MTIKTVGVLGCGLMGSGIAQVCAASGYKTIVREVGDVVLQKGLGRVKKFLDDGVAKGKVAPEARDTTLANLSGTTTFEALKDCDLIIEAIVENLDEKRQDLRRPGERSSARTRSSCRTPRRSASPSSRRRPSAPTGSAGCTSSTRCRS